MPVYAGQHVYLADVDPHNPIPIRARADVRARTVLHVLFAESLILGDSQTLNNVHLRDLFTDGGTRAEHDLAALLHDGSLRLARRADPGSFRAIRDNHAARGVDNVPPEWFADWLDEVCRPYLVSWELSEVEARFKGGVTARLAAEIARSDGAAATVLNDAADWVKDQSSLLYRSVRDWKDDYRDRSEVALSALQRFDDLTGLAYRAALPAALGADVADQSRELQITFGGRTLRAEVRLPASLLHPAVLAKLPVQVIQEALGLPDRKLALVALADLRHGRDPGDELLAALSGFAEAFHRLAVGSLRSVAPEMLDVLRWNEVRMRCRRTEDAQGVRAAALDVAEPDGTVRRDAYELFVQSTPIPVDQRPAPREEFGDLMYEQTFAGPEPERTPAVEALSRGIMTPV